MEEEGVSILAFYAGHYPHSTEEGWREHILAAIFSSTRAPLGKNRWRRRISGFYTKTKTFSSWTSHPACPSCPAEDF
jgi:hypothetical protein